MGVLLKYRFCFSKARVGLGFRQPPGEEGAADSSHRSHTRSSKALEASPRTHLPAVVPLHPLLSGERAVAFPDLSLQVAPGP